METSKPFINLPIIDYLIYDEGEQEAIDNLMNEYHCSEKEAKELLDNFEYLHHKITGVQLDDETAFYSLYFKYNNTIYGIDYWDTAFYGGDVYGDAYLVEEYYELAYRRKK